MSGKHSRTVPNTAMVKLLLSGRTTELHKLTKPGLVKKTNTMKGIASLLQCSTYKFKKVVEALVDDVPLENLEWCAGRRPEISRYKKAHKEWITNRNTLRRQAGMSLQERANAANRKFGINLTKYFIRLMYKRSNITLQKCRS
jgi:hypothetical protein